MPTTKAMTLDELVAGLREAYRGELRSVVLYGSGATAEHIAARSDYNVLVLVESAALDRLRAAGAVTQAWVRGGNPPPLTMTPGEWRGSADIFPMEYADILERHRVLFGAPPFDGVAVEPADLRVQVEQQAMGKLLQLRQGVLAAGGDVQAQATLLAASLGAIMTVLRAVVRLHDQSPRPGHVELARQVGELAGLDPEPFVRVAAHARGEQPLQGSGVTLVLGAYLAGVERVVSYVNEFVHRA